MQHFAPHASSVFEGYYSKFDLPSGAHLALIICTVPNATTHPPHMVSLTYYPRSPSSSCPIFQRHHWVSAIHRITISQETHAFELRVPGLGFMRVYVGMGVSEDETTTYEFSCEEWRFEGTARGATRTPWRADDGASTPEGWLVRLPLPLHWHVHSLSSSCDFQLGIPSLDIDCRGVASVHQEKNWAKSFPAAHMWVQARDPATRVSVCLAGGKILGMDAYIVGFRSSVLDLDFKPPFALSLCGISPFMAVEHDWTARSFRLCVSDALFSKLEVVARAPAGEVAWFGLGCPFPEGHRESYCTETFLARVEVRVSERQWWRNGSSWWGGFGAWREVKTVVWEGASLEFGGEYFPARGRGKQK